ncbi:MAG: DUF1579 domain-containing protein [Chitinophagaceae bacterium]|nr:DUF1579 domain-containing protein [Chitinophagaceae bacterium]
MKKIILAFCTSTMFLFACNSGGENSTTVKDSSATSTTTVEKTTTPATAEPEKKDTSPAASTPMTLPDSATMMKNMEAYMTVGDVHKMMASWNGNWNAEVIGWNPFKPDAPADTNKATTTNKMVLGGRYQMSTTTGKMMGMPFEGISTLAFDNSKKTFISTWIDNMGTGMMKLEGPWDEATKSMTLKGKCVNASMGDGKETDIREKFTIVDDNTQLMEMYGTGPDGKEMKMMQINFTRKK